VGALVRKGSGYIGLGLLGRGVRTFNPPLGDHSAEGHRPPPSSSGSKSTVKTRSTFLPLAGASEPIPAVVIEPGELEGQLSHGDGGACASTEGVEKMTKKIL